MIIVKIMGGLGNQLQQYAFYRKLESLGRDVRLDVSWFERPGEQEAVLAKRTMELNCFEGVRYRPASDQEIRGLLGRLWEEPESVVSRIRRKLLPSHNPCFVEQEMYHEEVFHFTDKYLAGYWACEKYYADILDGLRRELRFPVCAEAEIRHRNEEMIEKIKECL